MMEENAASPVQMLIAQQFDSFEELSAISVAFDIDFRQLNAERFKSETFQAQLGSMLIGHARFGCTVDQYGATPKGMRTFALPDSDCPEIRWFGRQVEQDVLLAFPTHGELRAFSRVGFSVFTFSLSDDLLANYFQQTGNINFTTVLDSGEKVLAVDPLLLNQLRFRIRQLELLIKNGSNAAFLTRLGAILQEQILAFLFDAICISEPVAKLSEPASRRSFSRALDYIRDHKSRSVLNTELCTYAQASERTLQTRFKHELDMTPKAYMAAQRLYNIHRALWHADPTTTRVGDLANNWGFWHMGQFAADYRKLFGELPSTTLKRGI